MNRDNFASLSDTVVRCMILNLRGIASRKDLRMVTWAAVSQVFGTGSTSATALCRRAGIDPDLPLGKQR